MINTIRTKHEQDVELGKFNVLVGANNVGKSQTLRDIHQKMVNRNARTTIVESMTLDKPDSFDELIHGLEILDDPNNINHKKVRGIQANLTSGDEFSINLEDIENQFDAAENLDFILGNISRFRISYLDAESRLQVAKSQGTHNPKTSAPQNLLQALFSDTSMKTEKELNKVFKDTFGLEVRLDYSEMTSLSLKVAKEFKNIPEDPRAAFDIMSAFHKIDQQGDGFRSFVGVVLSLLLSEGRVVLLDEPEAFLHPAQARMLGSWIAKYSQKVPGQIIVATHNSNFLSGILSSNQEVNIFRLNRKDDNTAFQFVPADATKKIVKSPLLSSQRVLEAFFHTGVVVCEADADRAFYQSVTHTEFNNQNILYVHAHNKQTIKEVVKILKNADIPVAGIADIDILNTKADLKNLLESLTNENIDEILTNRDELAKKVEGKDENRILADITTELKTLIEQLEKKEHNLSGAKGAINRVIKERGSKWSEIKKKGLAEFPNGSKNNAKKILADCRNHGLFIVPNGELESWIDNGIRSKSKWIIKALTEVSKGNSPNEIKKFIKDILTYMGEDIT